MRSPGMVSIPSNGVPRASRWNALISTPRFSRSARRTASHTTGYSLIHFAHAGAPKAMRTWRGVANDAELVLEGARQRDGVDSAAAQVHGIRPVRTTSRRNRRYGPTRSDISSSFRKFLAKMLFKL